MAASIQTSSVSTYSVQSEDSERKLSADSGSGQSAVTRRKSRLTRTGSDTIDLVSNEHPLASSESEYKMNLSSETTTYTSIELSPSVEEIPYIDGSSEEGEE